jgi:hypothetical protein
VGDRRSSRVSIGREVNSRLMSRESEKGSNETRVLVRVTVVLLSPEGARLDVVEGGVGSGSRKERKGKAEGGFWV